jgi:uncharacterized protein (DUF1778 family)
MFSDDNRSETIVERKSARMEQRVKPSVKQTIEQAAAMLGIDAAEFVTNEAFQGAEAVLARQEVTRLSAEDRTLILGLLTNPPKPTQDLVDLVAMDDEIEI